MKEQISLFSCFAKFVGSVSMYEVCWLTFHCIHEQVTNGNVPLHCIQKNFEMTKWDSFVKNVFGAWKLVILNLKCKGKSHKSELKP
jgi:hypothetical protein